MVLNSAEPAYSIPFWGRSTHALSTHAEGCFREKTLRRGSGEGRVGFGTAVLGTISYGTRGPLPVSAAHICVRRVSPNGRDQVRAG